MTIRFWSDKRLSVDIGVTGVCSNVFEPKCFILVSLTFEFVSPTVGFSMLLSILSGLNGNKLLAAKPALMFLGVNAFLLAGLNREVKCSLPIAFTPPRSNRSTCSRYAAFSGAKTATSQGWSLWEVWEGRWQRIILFVKQNSRIMRVLWVPKLSQIKIWGFWFVCSLVSGLNIRFSHCKLM